MKVSDPTDFFEEYDWWNNVKKFWNRRENMDWRKSLLKYYMQTVGNNFSSPKKKYFFPKKVKNYDLFGPSCPGSNSCSNHYSNG